MDQEILFQLSGNVGANTTNNVCEYIALVYGLVICNMIGANILPFSIYSDSELLVKQLKKEYKTNTPHMALLNQMTVKQLNILKEYSIQHVLRHHNKEADWIANSAVNLKDKSLKIDF